MRWDMRELFVRDAAQMHTIKRLGPMSILRRARGRMRR